MSDSIVKHETENCLVYTIDNNTQLEFLSHKTIVVIDKDRFLVCKQLMLENAPGKMQKLNITLLTSTNNCKNPFR